MNKLHGVQTDPSCVWQEFRGKQKLKEIVLCNSVKLVKIGFLNALDIKKINHWMHKEEPLHMLSKVMKARTACSIYNLESMCSTTVFGHITFIIFAEQLLSCSVLEAQKRLYGLCNLPPKLLYFNKTERMY